MAQPLGGWIHSFAVTETGTHKKGYTIYKITSIIFPRAVPEALTCISVWKRFHDVKRLYRDLHKRHRNLSLSGKVPEPKNDFFKRFDPEVIKARRDYIIFLLDFVAQHPALYKSQCFLSFFEKGYSPNNSPLHKNSNKIGNIEKICNNLDITYENNIVLIDPNKDNNSTNETSKIVDSVDDSTEICTSNTNEVCDQDFSELHEITKNISKTPILTPMVSIEEGDTDYIYEAALEFSQAVQAEVNLEYENAHKKYKNGIEILLTGSKNEKNEERKFIAKAKVAKYMNRADELYEKYISHSEIAKKLSFQLSIDMSEDSSIETSYIERPWNQLSRYKVIQIIDSVLQVQDVTDKSVYILKGIEKPTYNSKTQSIFLPQGVPFMVELIGYFQSLEKIFLLLTQAKGGKLFDYIRMYTPNTGASISLNEIFTEIKIKTSHEDIFEEENKNTNIDNIEYDISKRESRIDTAKYNNFQKDSTSKVTDLDIIKNNIHPSTKNDDNSNEHIPSLDKNSHDMDINELVDCSKKLLNSVTKTLNKSKNNEPPLVDLNNSVKVNQQQNTNSDLKKENVNYEEKVEDSQKLNIKINSKFSVPEVSIKQWARELVVAIDSLHSKGVILGDLHPDNILLGSKGQLLLSYFYQNEGCGPGINFSFNPLVNETLCVAPERPLTIKSDWWSFGVVLFQLITGCSFRSCHPAGIYMYYEIQFPSTDISDDAKHLLENLLVVAPENRFDITSIKAHTFFDGSNWTDLYKQGVNYM